MTNKGPKILLYDLETFPNIGYVWGKWEQNVIDYVKEWSIASFSAKWLGGKHITKCLADYRGYKPNGNDEAIVKELWSLCDEADILIAHNGDQFDVKKMNSRFTFYGLKPPAPYKTIDTKKVAKRHFAFNSNSLNDLGKHLNLGEKVETGGFQLWLDCMSGDKAAWNKMKKYNRQDVVLLEKVYLHLLPWIQSHPTVGMFRDKVCCPKCGSDKIHARGFAVSKTMKYRKYQCQSCGSWGRSATAEASEQKPIVSL